MGLIQGAYGAGRRLWNVLGTSRHVQTICTIAGGFGTGYTLGDNRVGMDPETLRLLEARRALGRERAVDASAPVAADPRGAQATARGSSPSIRFGRGPPPRATGTSRRCPARTPRSRSACCTSCWPKARKIASSSAEHTLGWEAFRAAHPRVPAVARRRHHRALGRVRSSSWASGWPTPGRPAFASASASNATAAAAWRCGRSRAFPASPATGAIRAAASATTRAASSA